jgi:hypothetical protein
MSFFFEPEFSYTRSILIKFIETFQSYDKKWRALVWAYCRCSAFDKN